MSWVTLVIPKIDFKSSISCFNCLCKDLEEVEIIIGPNFSPLAYIQR